MRSFSVIFSVLAGLTFVNAAFAQEPPPYQEPVQTYDQGARYPALGQGDTTPGTPQLPQDLELTVAAGVGYAPEYMGSDDYEAIFAPAIDFEYKQRAFLVIDRDSMMVPYEGAGVKLLSNQDFSIGLNLTYDKGRSDDTSLANGIGDLDWTVLGGGFAAWHPGIFFVRGQLGYDLLDEFNSYKGEVGLGVAGPINPNWRGKIELSSAFAGEDYNEAYWGIKPFQASASGLPLYNPDGGFYRTSLTGTLQYQFTQGAFVQGILRYDALTGDAADSPLVEDDSQFSAQAMAGYRF